MKGFKASIFLNSYVDNPQEITISITNTSERLQNIYFSQ